MTALDLQSLRAEGQAFMEAISRESYLAFAGLKKSAELRPIYDKYERVLSPEALDLTLDLFKSAPDKSEDQRSARLLLEWEIESQAAKPLAELDEREIEWENSAVVHSPDGRVIQYQAVPIEISNTRDRNLRLAIDKARAKLVKAEHAPLRLERLQREKDFIESLGVSGDYNSAFAQVKRSARTRWLCFARRSSTTRFPEARWRPQFVDRLPKWESTRWPGVGSSSTSAIAKENALAPFARR